LSFRRASFPTRLKEIPEPPVKLYARGDFSCLKSSDTKFLCVVGTRRASQYGVDACRSIVEGLRGQDIIIISGLAIGIDTVAHESALRAGLKTVAVVCSGLDWSVLYPRQNERLAKEIVAAGGVIVSEFDGTYRPHNFNFPQRNRIMAGISDATLVVEALPASGTLITARLTLDYNRDVLAVPGSIFSTQSVGTNKLIAGGAVPITSSKDILEFFNINDSENSTTKAVENLLEHCSPLEKQIFELLASPLHRTEIFNGIKENAQAVSIAISNLEITGLITLSGDLIRRNKN